MHQFFVIAWLWSWYKLISDPKEPYRWGDVGAVGHTFATKSFCLIKEVSQDLNCSEYLTSTGPIDRVV